MPPVIPLQMRANRQKKTNKTDTQRNVSVCVWNNFLYWSIRIDLLASFPHLCVCVWIRSLFCAACVSVCEHEDVHVCVCVNKRDILLCAYCKHIRGQAHLCGPTLPCTIRWCFKDPACLEVFPHWHEYQHMHLTNANFRLENSSIYVAFL